MELRDYLSIFRRRFGVFAAVFIVTATAFGLGTFTKREPVYEATAKILVQAMPAARNTFGELISSYEDANYALPTREALISCREVYRYAAALELSAGEKASSLDWHTLRHEEAIQMMVDAGHARMEGDNVRILETDPLAKRMGIWMGTIAVSKPNDKVQILHVVARSADPKEPVLKANIFARSAALFSQFESRRALTTILNDLKTRQKTLEAENASNDFEREALGQAIARAEVARRTRLPFFYFFQPARSGEVRNVNRPDGRLLVLGLAIALVVAVGAAYLWDYVDTRIYTEQQMVHHAGLPCLAVLGRIREPLAAIVEEVGLLAALVRRHKVLMVSSAIRGEGKTVLAVNLAASLARSGRRVVLLDAHLRGPRLHSVLSLDNRDGLSTAMGHPVESLLRSTELGTLWVLTGGPVPEYPEHISSSPGMRDLLRTLSERYDVVVMDTAPILSAGESLTLATLSDGVLLVVGKGRSDRRDGARAKKLLDGVRANLLGAVLNRGPFSSKGSA